MASTPSRIVVIGASLAGASAAVALREQGFQGELTLIGEEDDLPYERPPLSKAMLLGDADEPDWVKDEAFYADHHITLRLGTTATRIDRRAQSRGRRRGGVRLRQVADRHRVVAPAARPARRRTRRPAQLRTLGRRAGAASPVHRRCSDRDRRRRLDRLRGGRRRTQARRGGDDGRSAVRAAGPRGGRTGGRRLRGSAPRPRRRSPPGHRCARILRGRRGVRGTPQGRRQRRLPTRCWSGSAPSRTSRWPMRPDWNSPAAG